MRVAFVACVEPGRLEEQALLLFRSLRRFGGGLAGARALSLQPRAGDALRPQVLAGLHALDVEHRHEALNRDFTHYPIANKLFAAAWAESHLDEDVIVFVDTDSFLCGEPSDLLLADDCDAALRPVNKVNIASQGPEDPKERYWQRVWKRCGVEPPPLVETAVDGRPVRAYWNTGLVALRRRAGLAERWLAAFRDLVGADCLPYNGLKNMDQVALAATLARAPERVRVLDRRYNYPLPKRAELPEPWCSCQLEELVHVHYFRWFNRPDFLASLTPPLSPDSPLRAWLAAQLPLQPLVPDARRKTGAPGRSSAAEAE